MPVSCDVERELRNICRTLDLYIENRAEALTIKQQKIGTNGHDSQLPDEVKVLNALVKAKSYILEEFPFFKKSKKHKRLRD